MESRVIGYVKWHFIDDGEVQSFIELDQKTRLCYVNKKRIFLTYCKMAGVKTELPNFYNFCQQC